MPILGNPLYHVYIMLVRGTAVHTMNGHRACYTRQCKERVWINTALSYAYLNSSVDCTISSGVLQCP